MSATISLRRSRNITLAFSGDLCYNGTNEKPRPLGEVAAKPTERAQLCAKNPLTRYRGSSPKGRASGRVHLQGDGLCPVPVGRGLAPAAKQISAENLFSLPICVIMKLTKSLSLWERWRRSRQRGQIVATTTLSPAIARALPKGEP